jgi:hypothetical protein
MGEKSRDRQPRADGAAFYVCRGWRDLVRCPRNSPVKKGSETKAGQLNILSPELQNSPRIPLERFSKVSQEFARAIKYTVPGIPRGIPPRCNQVRVGAFEIPMLEP